MDAKEFARRVALARSTTNLNQTEFGNEVAKKANKRGYSTHTYKRIENGDKVVHDPDEQRRWAEPIAEVAGLPLSDVYVEDAPSVFAGRDSASIRGVHAVVDTLAARVLELEIAAERHQAMLLQITNALAISEAENATAPAPPKRDGNGLRVVGKPRGPRA